MKTLLQEYQGHIKGYGFMTDLNGNTVYGIPVSIADKYDKIVTEFEQDDTLELYKVGKKNPGLYDIPYQEIPRGTLRVYGIKIRRAR